MSMDNQQCIEKLLGVTMQDAITWANAEADQFHVVI